MNKKNVKTGGKMNSEPRSELLHQYHLLIESAKLAVIEFDKAGKMVWANRNALETLGVSDASKAGSIADVIRKEGVFDIMGNPLLPETLPMNIVATQKIPVTDFKCSLEISKGKRIMYSINMVPLLDKNNDLTGILSSFKNIQSEFEAKKALESSDKAFHIFYDAVLGLAEENDIDVIIKLIADHAKSILNANDCAVYIFNYEDMVLEPVYSNAVPEDREAIMNYKIELGEGLSGTVAESGVPTYINYDQSFDIAVHIPGTDENIDERESVISVPLFSASGEMFGAMTLGKYDAIFSDEDLQKLSILARLEELAIQRIKTTESLVDSEEKYRMLIEEIHDAIFIISDSRYSFFNDSFMEMTGYLRDELIDMNSLEIIHPDDREKIRAIAVARKENKKVPEMYTAKVIRKNGEVRKIEFSSNNTHYKGKPAVLIVARDITQVTGLD